MQDVDAFMCSPNDDPALAQRYGVMEWVSRIENALAHDLFELYAQSIVDIHEQHDQGFTLRILLMRDGQRRHYSSGSFMPAVERYHLSARVDRWVGQTCFGLDGETC